jgi:formamidopyrimidine-DNA glycosylase
MLDDNHTLLLHLGMSGRMVLSTDAPPIGKHDHISFAFDNGLQARFNDPRRFGVCDLVRSDQLAAHKLLAHLGVEPLSPAFTAACLHDLFKGRTAPIKTALLDQKLIVGVGNIYACESLFRARISPLRPAGACTMREIAALRDAIVAVLNEAIAAGGSSLRDYVQADGELGYFQHNFAVYDREGQPCPGCTCKGKIERVTQAGRSTFFCRKKQK